LLFCLSPLFFQSIHLTVLFLSFFVQKHTFLHNVINLLLE
jgi:hypothetical protein